VWRCSRRATRPLSRAAHCLRELLLPSEARQTSLLDNRNCSLVPRPSQQGLTLSSFIRCCRASYAEKGTLSDGSEYPLSMISSLRSLLKDSLADSGIGSDKLAKLQSVRAKGLSTEAKCLHRYLQKSRNSQNKSVWVKDHEHSYACRACVNKQRLCISITQGQMLVLPLRPLFRTPGKW